jgi:uroporphyrinogen decarboxylase
LTTIQAFRRAGYDYAPCGVPGFGFAVGQAPQLATRSLNDGAVIVDRAGFEAYPWPDPEAADCGILDRLAEHLPAAMKLVVPGPYGVLENAIRLVGYDALCYLLMDDEALAGEVFAAVGSRLVRYYERCMAHEAVGALISNDDWGFRSQTLLSVAQMRRHVFPWHRRIVATAHAVGKPAILHSCGCLEAVMADIVDDMRFDAKHSFEDAIEPIESAYERWHGRIALLGGIDLDFICRSRPEQVHGRARRMLERAAGWGAYALGTGNSVPEYVPDDRYLALIRAAWEPPHPS